MKEPIRSLQTTDLLRAKYIEGTPALTKTQKSSLIYLYARILESIRSDGEQDWYTINVKDMTYHLDGNKGGNNAIIIFQQLKEIQRTQILIEYEDVDGEMREQITSPILSIDRPVTASGSFKVQISKLVLENIQFRSGYIFRWIELNYFRKLRSPKTMDLYEALKSVENLSYWNVPLADLRSILNVHKQYKKFAHLRQYVLLPAQDDIRKNTDITFHFEEVRGPRNSVLSVIFKVKKKPIKKKTIIGEDSPPKHFLDEQTTVKTEDKEEAEKIKKTKALHKRLTDKGIFRPENFKLRDSSWIQALDEEDDDAIPKFIVRTAQIIDKRADAAKAKAEDKSKSDDIFNINKSWYEKNRKRFKGLSPTETYLQNKNGTPLLFSDEKFKEKIADYVIEDDD